MEYYTFEGVIKEVFDTQEFKNNFKKREVVLETEEDYPQLIKFEFTDENGINKLDDHAAGEKVKIAFLLKGSEWQGKYFTNLRGVAIALSEEAASTGKPKKDTKKDVLSSMTKVNNNEEDELPF
jgi:single-strand DNA-binding protein